MENPQAQMPQGQPGQAPQQGGQDQQMQQVMQVVQQMVEQGMQPVEIAAQLLQQVPPEAIMQVFVQMGIPQEEAQASIQEAMQQGQQAQQPQGPGEEQMEGAASNPAEEATEMQMMYGGKMPKRLVKRQEGGGNPEQEMQAVMGQVQQMMQNGSDARQVMEQIQAAAQQGQISPEVAQAVMEQLSGQMQATDPQGGQEGTDPQAMDPNMASPDSQMMAFGGNLKKLMSKAFGGDLTPPSIDSKTYAQDRASMITNAIKNNTFKSTLNSDFPSLGGNQMMYGGDLPKADLGAFDIGKYKTKDEAELAAYRYRQGLSPEEQAKFNIDETVKTWKAPEPTYEAGKSYEFDPTTKQFKVKEAPAPTYEAGKNYQYDPATKGFKAVDTPAVTGQGAQGVGYPNPLGGGLYNNLYHGASPMARFMANSQVYGMPRIKGSNLPGGMDASAFMMQAAGKNLAPGMAGTANGQNYRVTGVEDIKGGLFGRKKVGVRYNIDWGNPAAVAQAQAQGQLPAGPGFSGFNADANGDNIPDYLGAGTTDMNTGTAPVVGPQNQPAATTPAAAATRMTPTGGSGMGAMEQLDELGLPIQQSTAPALPQNNDNGLANTSIDQRTFDAISGIQAGDYDNRRNAHFDYLKTPEYVQYVNNDESTPADAEAVNKKFLSIGARQMSNLDHNYYDKDREKKTWMDPSTNLLFNSGNTPTLQNPMNGYVAAPTAPEEPMATMPINRPSGISRNQSAGLSGIPAFNQRQEVTNFQNSQADKGLVWNAATNSWVPQAALALEDAQNTPVAPKFQTYDAIAGPNFASQQDLMNIANNNPPSYRAYGGGVDAQALNNAVQLINKAFGGMMPMARNGMEMQSSIDITNKNKFNPDWDAVSDMYMNTGNRLVNFMDGANAMNPQRDIARMSALNTQPMEFSQMKQGLYDQAGNFIPNDIGNQVLNPTDVYYNQERQVFEYGGRIYEMGGDIELDDNELAEFQRAGFKISKI